MMINKRCLMIIVAKVFFGLSMIIPITVAAQGSVRLEDTIKNGIGDVNVLIAQGKVPLSTASLEALRIDNDGHIVFGVDINEAASGTEKAETQGVAIAQLTLSITRASGTTTYSEFFTRTQTVVAPTGTDNRATYYSLIGGTGSNKITGSVIDGSGFDSTLWVVVNDSVVDATAVHLSVTLLETNVSLGDPEAFYDYSAGFEDLALLNASDAAYLDAQAAGRDQAPLVILTDETAEVVASYYSPSATGYYIVAYEDEFPRKGDYDLNDLVVAYRVTLGIDESGQVKTIEANGYLIARGGLYDHDWHLRIPIGINTRAVGEFALYNPPGAQFGEDQLAAIDTESDLDIKVFSNTTSLFTDPLSPFVNTISGADIIPGQKFTFHITLENAIAMEHIGPPPFDPYLVVNNRGYEIHLPGMVPINPNAKNWETMHTQFVDEAGYPFAHIFPEAWQNPLEWVDIGEAYPNLLNFIDSGKTENLDWYLQGVPSLLSPINQSQWQW